MLALLYSLTLFPGVGGQAMPGDAAKFQYMSVIAGVPHAPGYPLYVLLGAGWIRLWPWLAPAPAMNMLSALLMASAVVAVFYGALALGVRRGIACVACVTLGVGTTLWLHATEAGPMSLSAVLLAIAVLGLLRWRAGGRPAWLLAALSAAVVGVSQDSLLLWMLPVVLAAAVLYNPRGWARPAPWFGLAGALAVLVGLYIFVYWRARGGVQSEFVPVNATWYDMLKTAIGAQFWPNYFVIGMRKIALTKVPELLHYSVEELHVCGAACAALGVAALMRRAPAAAVLLFALALSGCAFTLHQYTLDPRSAYWFVYLLSGYFMAVGLDCLATLAGRLRAAAVVLFCACVALSVSADIAKMFTRENPYDIEELLYALPEQAQFLTLDEYTWSEVLRYMRFTNPYLARRVVRAVAEVSAAETGTTFLVDPAIRRQLAEQGIATTPVCSNDVAVLYQVGATFNMEN